MKIINYFQLVLSVLINVMSENKQVKSNRELYNERLKAKYPDKEFADDEAVFGQINDDYDNYDQELADYRDREKSLSELFSSDPRSAAFLMDWKNGENPLVGMIRNVGVRGSVNRQEYNYRSNRSAGYPDSGFILHP